MPEFHIGILPDRSAAQVAELAVEAESLGFAGIWVADSQSIFRDVFVTLSMCARSTSTLKVATGVTNPVTRHPVALAGAFATLDELSGGRAVLGIGVGESAVRTLQLPRARLSRLEEVTTVLRGLLAGDEVQFDGTSIRLSWPTKSIPIYIASSGPKSLRLAGRIADGVVFQVGAEPALVRYALDSIDDGLRDQGRAPGDVVRYVRLACSVDADRTKARTVARAYASVAATALAAVPRERMPAEFWADLDRMKEAYDYYGHGSDTGRHTALVTERLIDALSISGTPDDAIPRFQELIELGVDGFVIPIVSPDPIASMRHLAKDVIAKL